MARLCVPRGAGCGVIRSDEPGDRHRLGLYEIQGALGAGGMGEVYRARDTKLGREVAIKILPVEFAADPDRRARFEREARLLAALNHPNIAQIYGFEDFESVRALVMELIGGPTIAERLAGAVGAFPQGDAIAVARQIADALEAAHEKGIVHRDLKPANVKLTADGVVKVLDFGLSVQMGAIDLERSAAVTRTAISHAGVVVGTAVYMSPEQTRGIAVDKRTDIWAFGCVLYEMLAGRRAFGGATPSDVTAAVLEREPDWNALPRATPTGVRRLLHRCLKKDPKRRLRDIADARADLEEALVDESSSGHEGAPRSSKARFGLAALALAAGVIAAAAAVWRPRPALTIAGAMSGAIDRMTFDSGLTTMPALSPDGRLLAYASDRGGRRNLDIWVQQTAGGSPLQLTDDPSDDTTPDFSPDGSQIAFRSNRGAGGVFVVSALGGPARLIVEDGRGPRFSPDGSRIAYWTGSRRGNPTGGRAQLFVIPLAGGAPVRLLPDFAVAREPVWAPDGRSLIAFGRRDLTSPAAETVDWWWVSIDRPAAVKTGVLDFGSLRAAEALPLTWTSAGVLFTDGQNLWSVPIRESGVAAEAPRRVTLGTGVYRFATSARDGTVAFDARSSERVIERVATDGDPSTLSPSRLLTDGQEGAGRASSTRDGSVIAFERAAPGRWEVWTKQLRTGREQLLVSVPSATEMNATIADDGSRISYTATDGPGVTGRGFVIEIGGGVPKAVCTYCGLHGFLGDHQRLLLELASGRALRLHDLNTGMEQDLIRVEKGQLDRPHASPDDRWLAFRYRAVDSSKTFLAPLTPDHVVPPERWQQIDDPTHEGRPAGWSLDSRTLYLLLDTDGFRCLWGQRIDPVSGRLIGAPFPVKHFHGEQVASGSGVSTSFGNALSAPGFIYESMQPRSDIWRLRAVAGQIGRLGPMGLLRLSP